MMTEEHPANVGLDFSFHGSISREVLGNYLSRSMIIVDCGEDTRLVDDDLRMILNTGAKYIARAGGAWVPTKTYIDSLADRKDAIMKMHQADPELVFEAAIFECVTTAVNDITIPAGVLVTFGQKVEDRCFRYSKMVHRWFRYRNQFGKGHSVPDMSRVEARMFFYHMACQHIDAGYEGLHLGQVHLMAMHDKRWAHWTELLGKIREYADNNARRKFVLTNAHTFGICDAQGKLMFDFHVHPVRGRAPEGSVPHAVTEHDPQMIQAGVGLSKSIKNLNFKDSIFRHSLGGMTHSGWSCASLPYLVELDNWNGYTPELLDKPSFGEEISWWGFDEISWFANQPQWYRSQWLKYIYNWVRETDPMGHFEMPGRRTAALRQQNGSIRQMMYSASKTDGFGDEDTIREVWVGSRQSSEASQGEHLA
jgi:hypothetical protein